MKYYKNISTKDQKAFARLEQQEENMKKVHTLIIILILTGLAFLSGQAMARHVAPITFEDVKGITGPNYEAGLPGPTGVKFSQWLPDGTDLDRLSYAVAMAETRNCDVKTNFTVKNNCHGIILSRGIAWYETQEESHDHFKDIWKRLYGKYPDIHLANKWTGNDRKESWLLAVNQYYNEK